ncbi:MAG: hypothetical protein V4787_11575 [Pseudomonadota bacterium]
MNYVKSLLVAGSMLGGGIVAPGAFEALQAVQAQDTAIVAPAAPAEAVEPPATPTTTTTTTTTAPSRPRAVHHDEEQLIPKTTEGKTLLGVVLVACGWFFIFTIQRFNRRSKAEGDLDQRLPLILQNVTEGWQKLNHTQATMIDKAEARADRAMDERETLMKQFIEHVTAQNKIHSEELAKTRDHFTESQRRLHERVDQNEKQHAECARKLEDTERKLNQLDQRQYNAALVAAPVAPVPLTLPPTGLTITPGTGSAAG